MDKDTHEELMRMGAVLTAHKMLLEQVYANAFQADPDGFTAFMEAMRRIAQKPWTGDAKNPPEQMAEFKVLLTEQLQKFEAATKNRIAEKRSAGTA